MSGFTRIDLPHHDLEGTRAILETAAGAIDGLALQDDLRPAAFLAAALILAGKTVHLDPAGPTMIAPNGLRL